MDIRFQNLGPEQWKAEIMLAPACEGEDILRECPELDKAAPWLTVAPAMRDFKGKDGELALLHGHPELSVPRVLAVGLGPREKVDAARLRAAIAAAVQRCRGLSLNSILLPEPALSRLPGGRERLVEECVYAAQLALYRFTALKKPQEDEPADPQWLALGFDGQSVPDGEHAAARRGERAAKAVALARDLANMPGNLLYPESLAQRAVELGRELGFTCTVLDETALAGEGMGALLAVGQGSARPPRLVVLEHAPEGHEKDKPLILVGKGITFDSGGISIKPAAGMWEMKGDMGGAAAVMGLFEALGQLETPRRVIGLMACAENMPDARATRPGDVVKTLSGKTVEIVNTDAEGRLVLCDALTYAQRHWNPSMIVDVATLTGACVVALGDDVAGLFCQDATLAQRIKDFGDIVGEPYWPLPLWDRYFELLKSETADFANAGARAGGASSAAVFLKQFITFDGSWAHLDIAGPGFVTRKIPNCPAGGTGFAVRTLIELAENK